MELGEYTKEYLDFQIDKLTIPKLKLILKHYNLKIGGSKQELIDRIRTYWSEKGEEENENENEKGEEENEKSENENEKGEEEKVEKVEKIITRKPREKKKLMSGIPSSILTGIREGEYLVGIDTQSLNAVVKLVKGFVPPYKEVLDDLRKNEDSWSKFIQKIGSIVFFSKMSFSEREDWLNENQSDEDIYIDETENGVIEIVDLGKSVLSAKVDSKNVIKLLTEGPINVKDLRKMFPYKPGSKGLKNRATLMFRRNIWAVTNYDCIVDDFEGIVIDTETGNVHHNYKNKNKNKVIHVIESLGSEKENSIGLLTPKKQSKSIDEITMNVILKYFPDDKDIDESSFQSCTDFVKNENLCSHLVNPTVDKVKRIEDGLKGFTPAGLKSVLQKIVRFRSEWVEFGPIINNEHYPSDLVLLVTLRKLMMSPGSFVPDIQRFVTGMESAFKRLIVTLCEDAIFSEEKVSIALGIMGGAFLAQRVKNWKPSEKLVVNAFQLALDGFDSNVPFKYDINEGLTFSYSLDKADNKIKLISFLLDEMRSFESDLGMVRSIAKHFPAIGEGNKVRPCIMPIEHGIDQHWAPEIVFFFPRNVIEENKNEGSKPFSTIMKRIFSEVTGVNCRRANGRKGRVMNIREYDENFEQREFVKLTRQAQYLMLFSKQNEICMKSNLKKKKFEYNYTLDRSWIAGMVGAMEINLPPHIIVTLNPNEIEELKVIRKPSRDKKNDEINNEIKDLGIKSGISMLKRGIISKEPRFKGVNITRKENIYYIDDVDWDNYRKNIVIEMNLMKNKELDTDETKWMIKTLQYWEKDGIVENIKDEIYKILENEREEDIRRVISYMNGYKIKINGISRDGGGSKYAVVISDAGAFHILLKLSYLAPSVIKRVLGKLDFEVLVFSFFIEIREWITEFLRKNKIKIDNEWGNIEDLNKRDPWGHQVRAIEEMKEAHLNGRKGHFLWITRGGGKTFVTLSYIKYLYEKNELPPYIIYSLPSSALDSIVTEILAFNLKYELLIPIKKVDKILIPKYNVVHGNTPNPHVVTIIQHDHLKKCIDEVSSVMTDAIFIIDEVHETLNETLRTTSALHLSNLAREFIALTGTPIIDNHIYKLIWWLKRVVPFEVTVNSFWVAVNGMVSKIVKTGVKVIRKNSIVEMNLNQMEKYQKLVPPSLGGKNSNPSPGDFIKAINVCYEVCTDNMIEIALKYKKCGVFMVAKDNEHQKVLFKKLIEGGMSKENIFLIEKNASLTLNDKLVEKKQVNDYKIVITTIRRATGYTLSRLKIMITSVYPSNNAVRTQLEGRIDRIDQNAEKIWYYTFHTGILTNILERHRDAQNLMNALKAIAEEINIQNE